MKLMRERTQREATIMTQFETWLISVALVLSVITTLVNIALSAFILKLYTEFFKERVKGK